MAQESALLNQILVDSRGARASASVVWKNLSIVQTRIFLSFLETDQDNTYPITIFVEVIISLLLIFNLDIS